ncbi:manganese efflux pump MntP family protein [Peribacillus simplex]|uniref:manganese efflux pump MntP n=1 Tax=Peribacillus simplex TaxID=1478 RepID=UPI003D2A796F
MNTFAGEIITLLLMAFALGMDAFSVGLGMGMFKLRLRQVFFIGLIVGVFHILMPLFGMGAGRFISEKFGIFATYAGGLLLIILGIQMFIPGKKGEGGARENKMVAPIGKGLFIFALGVSLDSFSVGLTLGIYGAKTIITILCFGLVATLLTWLGLLLGRKMQGVLGVYSEILGGSILCAFGLKLLFSF